MKRRISRGLALVFVPRPLAPAWTAWVCASVMQWSAVVAAVGFAHRWANRDFAWRATLSEAVFPVCSPKLLAGSHKLDSVDALRH